MNEIDDAKGKDRSLEWWLIIMNGDLDSRGVMTVPDNVCKNGMASDPKNDVSIA